MLVSSSTFTAANEKRLYRVFSDRTTGVETFSTGENSWSYGALYGKPWLVVTLGSTTVRKLYDYTNGHQGGTDSALQTHNTGHGNFETGFISPEDITKDFYIVSQLSTKRIRTTKHDGTS